MNGDHVRHVTSVEVFNSFLWDYLIIDLRSSELYENNHIDRAESCPVGSDTGVRFESHDQKDTVILYDADGAICSSRPASDSAEERHAQQLFARFTGSGTACVWLLRDGFAAFETAYPFMCTGHELCDPCLCYPQEIVPNLFLGSQIAADETKILINLRLTHILNCTLEVKRHQHKGCFETTIAISLIQTVSLPGVSIEYCQIAVEDKLDQDLGPHFKTAVDFIHTAISSGGRILVHCARGCSRSATFVLAYLMSANKLSLSQAVEHVKYRRSVIAPNASFMMQLQNFEQHYKE